MKHRRITRRALLAAASLYAYLATDSVGAVLFGSSSAVPPPPTLLATIQVGETTGTAPLPAGSYISFLYGFPRGAVPFGNHAIRYRADLVSECQRVAWRAPRRSGRWDAALLPRIANSLRRATKTERDCPVRLQP